jgi:hypothetical protein
LGRIADILLMLIIPVLMWVAFQPFKRSANLLRFNPLAPLPPLMFMLLYVMIMGMDAHVTVNWLVDVPIVLFSGWAGYFLLMFRYSYDGAHFTWFNGLWRRSIEAKSIQSIVWRRDKNRVAKVRFEYDGGTANMRTDLKDSVHILKRMAEEHHIDTRTERLPWWSI